MDLAVRTAHVDDADDIATAHIDGWRVGYRHLLPDDFLDSDEFASARYDGWRRWTWSTWVPGSELFVGLIDDRVLGFAHVGQQRDHPDVGELYGFYLHSTAWGSGLADTLMTTSTAWLASHGYAAAVLWVLRDNPRARRFYERHGWVANGREDSFAEAFGQALPAPLVETQYGQTL
jgi:GNAT superfamily N-acetyltransferase